MATIKLEGVEQLQERLIRTEKGWKDVHIPFKRAAIILYASIKRNFREGGRPQWEGDARPEGKRGNAPKHRDGQLLVDSGRLRASVTSQVGAGNIHQETHGGLRHTLEIGTNVKYANVHQFGFKGEVKQHVKAHERRIPEHTRIQRLAWGKDIAPRIVRVREHTQNVKDYTRTIDQNIPARPFLLLQESDRRDILEMFREWYGQILSGTE